jgi:hypothetical protein
VTPASLPQSACDSLDLVCSVLRALFPLTDPI